MTNEKLKHNLIQHTKYSIETGSEMTLTVEDAMEIIKALEAQTEWIPVSERLPKELDGTVLITVNEEVRTGQYSEFNNTWYKGDMGGVGGDDPIAWMPLPKRYEPQEGEEV